MIRSLAAVVALALFALPVVAQDNTNATATSVNGPVQVNSGDSFKNLKPGQALKPGDRVMALGSGTTTITFPDGCQRTVQPGTVVTVPAVSPCASGVEANVQRVSPGGTGAVGATAAGGVDWAAFWLIAGVVIVGDGASFYEDDNNTRSP